MAQSVTCPTLGFSSGHDLPVVRLRPTSGSVQSLCQILSPFPSHPRPLSSSPFLKINEEILLKKSVQLNFGKEKLFGKSLDNKYGHKKTALIITQSIK